jgi:lipoprotein-releasing system permease protein
LFIGVGGALLGIFLGWVICMIQINYGLIRIQAQGTFIIDSYPVAINVSDFILVFLTVSLIGYAASWLPVNKIRFLLRADTF